MRFFAMTSRLLEALSASLHAFAQHVPRAFRCAFWLDPCAVRLLPFALWPLPFALLPFAFCLLPFAF
jgi:hypothetical protein